MASDSSAAMRTPAENVIVSPTRATESTIASWQAQPGPHLLPHPEHQEQRVVRARAEHQHDQQQRGDLGHAQAVHRGLGGEPLGDQHHDHRGQHRDQRRQRRPEHRDRAARSRRRWRTTGPGRRSWSRWRWCPPGWPPCPRCAPRTRTGGAAARIASRTRPTRVACWEVASPPDWASAASTVSCSACPSADCPASRTETTRPTRDSEPSSRRDEGLWSAPVSVPSGPGGDHRDRGQRGPLQRRGQLGRLLAGRAGRQERGVVALRHARQRRQQRHGRDRARRPRPARWPSGSGRASRPVAAKKVPTKAIVAGRGAAPLDPGERKVASWQIRTEPLPSGRRRARFPNPQGFTGSATSAAG